jgi:hypothetical protein
MYKIKRVQTRPNIEVPWSFEKYPTSDEFLQHFKKNYIDTKKLVYNDRGKISEDRLVIISIQHWNTRKDFLDFFAAFDCLSLLLWSDYCSQKVWNHVIQILG